jgi:hypothetical protein
MTTPGPESLHQLPANQRRYVGTSENSSLKEKGLRIYEGEKGGTYVDADQEWLKGHAEKGHRGRRRFSTPDQRLLLLDVVGVRASLL